MKSVMKHDFSKAPSIKAPRSMFDRSFGYKTTFDAGYLIPFYIDDVLPGDTFNLQTTGFARMSTPYFPVMDNMYMDTHFFFVPLRLIWDNSRKFFGEQTDPADSIDYTIPKFSSFTPTEASLHDYMGLPVRSKAMTPNSIYHRGYNFIWNEWFRDQNLQDSVVVDTDDGPDTDTDYVLLQRGKRHDYFTSALPWPQKGDAVALPLGTSAPLSPTTPPVFGDNMDFDGVDDSANRAQIRNASGGAATLKLLHTDGTAGGNLYGGAGNSGTGELKADLTGVTVDLSTATASTINDIREAFQVQKLLERDARSGTRYSELVNNHFGVNFYDVSYRPEFLGGGSTPINVNTVPLTANNHTTVSGTTVNNSGAGDVGAFATVGFTGHGFTKSFVEHGFVIGLVSVRADLTYQQGMPRNFFKQTRYDIYWPSLAHLGEQEITNKEIYYNADANDDLVFGYQERYAEYRYKPSQITGAFRSEAAASLDAWHLSQEFSSLPTLGDTFIKETPPLSRVVQVTTEPEFIFDSYTMLRCARPMPVFGVPGMVDHF